MKSAWVNSVVRTFSSLILPKILRNSFQVPLPSVQPPSNVGCAMISHHGISKQHLQSHTAQCQIVSSCLPLILLTPSAGFRYFPYYSKDVQTTIKTGCAFSSAATFSCDCWSMQNNARREQTSRRFEHLISR